MAVRRLSSRSRAAGIAMDFDDAVAAATVALPQMCLFSF